MVALNDTFATIAGAREAINRHVLNDGESYRVYKTDAKRHILLCKDKSCSFTIRAWCAKKTGVTITQFKPHTCRPIVHYKNKQSSALWFLKDHHRASVIDNHDITPAQIQSDERLRFNNNINYMQAYRVKQALLVEIEGHEADCFGRFPAYLQHMVDTDDGALGCLSCDEDTGRFEAAAFAPSATINACRNIRKFVALDACHTKSKYPMMLMIAVGIDANDNAIPLSWALVPTENEEWWTWFCEFLKDAFDELSQEGYVFMSDRDKGLAAAVCAVFPQSCAAHCCQHIADNVQQKFGAKCRPLFWRCAWAKDREKFKVCNYYIYMNYNTTANFF
jgi:hypothetical protein